MNDVFGYFMISDVIFDVTMSSYPFIKSKYHNIDITIGFPSQKNSPIRILRPTQSSYWDFWRFRWFGDHLGLFWGPWRHKRGKNLKFWISDIVIGFLTPINFTNAHFQTKTMILSSLIASSLFLFIRILVYFTNKWNKILGYPEC